MSNTDNGQAEPVLTPAFPAPDFLEAQDGQYSDTDDEITLADADEQDDTDGDDDLDDTDYSTTDSQPGRTASATGKARNTGSDRSYARRIAAKAIALQSASGETRELLKTLLGSTGDDAASLTVDIMVGSPAEARRVGNSLVALRREFDEDPVGAGYVVMEMDRDALEQMWKLVHALGLDLPPRPPAAIGKAVRPLAKAVAQINASTVTLLTDALALTSRS